MTKTAVLFRTAGATLAAVCCVLLVACAAQDDRGTSDAPAPMSGSQRLEVLYSTLMGHVGAGEYDQVIEGVDKALVEFPGVAKLHFFRGFAYYQKGLLDQAVQDLTAAIGIDPTMKDAFVHRAWVYAARNELDLALADAARCIELDPAHADGYLVRGAVLLKKTEYEQARLAVAKAMELEPGNEKGKALLQQLDAIRRP